MRYCSRLNLLMCVSVPNRKLTKVLRNYVDNAEKPGISDQLYKAMKALEYIFKFIVRSRILFNQCVSPCQLSRGLGGDPFLPSFLPASSPFPCLVLLCLSLLLPFLSLRSSRTWQLTDSNSGLELSTLTLTAPQWSKRQAL